LLAPLARIALLSHGLPLSLADEKRVCSFVRPGQRRAILCWQNSVGKLQVLGPETCSLPALS
jgi:hypothetical protein